MSRLKIVHATGFSYEHPATASYNEARMLPQSDQSQIVLSSRLKISPVAAQHSYVDYWGTHVSTFEVLTPHRELSVTATSVVEVRRSDSSPPQTSWEALANLRESSTRFIEFSQNKPLTDPPAEVSRLATKIAAKHEDPCAAALDIAAEMHQRIEYTKGVTGVQTTAKHAWQARKGVCQDIAHVTLGALRSVGIPARYVSGYLLSKADAEVGETVSGESHAWVEWYCGDWYGFDPTNMLTIGDRHVFVARGRDYGDVSPLRGVYAGPDTSGVFVSVEITKQA